MRALIAALVAAGMVEVASAQVRVVRYDDDRLRGITEVDVVVAVAGDVERCGVSRVRLQQRTIDVLRESRLKATSSEKASSWFYSVLVSAHTAAVGSSCATAMTTELVAQVEGIPEADRYAPTGSWGSLLVGPLCLVRETAMATSAATEHAGSVDITLRAQLTAIGARISAANQ